MKTIAIDKIMTPHVETVAADSPVRLAADVMRKFDIGAVPVRDDAGLKGMLTDRDIAVRLVAEGKDPNATKVDEIMSRDAVTCFSDDSISDVAKRMEQKKIRRIVVIDHQRQPVGIVSIGDIAVHLGKQLGGEVLTKVSEPVHSQMKV